MLIALNYGAIAIPKVAITLRRDEPTSRPPYDTTRVPPSETINAAGEESDRFWLTYVRPTGAHHAERDGYIEHVRIRWNELPKVE